LDTIAIAVTVLERKKKKQNSLTVCHLDRERLPLAASLGWYPSVLDVVSLGLPLQAAGAAFLWSFRRRRRTEQELDMEKLLQASFSMVAEAFGKMD
jgi:hypothetical protein